MYVSPIRLSRFAVPLLLLILVFSSCEKDETLNVAPIQQTADQPYTGPAPETTLTGQFVEQLADAMQYPEVRTFLKEKVMLQFDGDYDFLIAFEKDSEISIKGQNEIVQFSDLFSYDAKDSGSVQKNIGDSFIDDLLDENPLL